jgi:HK97 family phage major capsid protein
MAVPLRDSIEGTLGNLTPTDFERGFLELIFGASEVAIAIPESSAYMMSRADDTISIIASGLVPEWISEVGEKPPDAAEFSTVDLNGVELSVLTAVSDRLLRDSVQDLESAILNEAAKGFANVLDQAILGNGTPAGWGSDLNTSAAAAGFSHHGADYTDVALFLSDMLGDLEGNDNFDRTEAVWLVSSSAWQSIRDGRTSNGEPLFIDDPAGESGVLGRIYGLPVYEVKSGKFAGGVDVFLVDMSKVVFGKRFNATQYDTSTEAAYAATAAGDLRSAFQHNETVYKWFDMFAFNIWQNLVSRGSGIELATS